MHHVKPLMITIQCNWVMSNQICNRTLKLVNQNTKSIYDTTLLLVSKWFISKSLHYNIKHIVSK